MPIINMKGPELSKSQKQKLITKFTQAASEVTEIQVTDRGLSFRLIRKN